MISNKHGHRHIPGATGSALGGGIGLLFGCLWVGFASKMGAPGVFPLFGIIFILFGVVMSVNGINKAQGYRAAEQSYKKRRREALEKVGDRAAG